MSSKVVIRCEKCGSEFSGDWSIYFSKWFKHLGGCRTKKHALKLEAYPFPECPSCEPEKLAHRCAGCFKK